MVIQIKIAFYSVVLNHHQANVADEFHKLLGDQYRFIELQKTEESKGCTENYSLRPYLIRAWHSQHEYNEAMKWAQEADACVFGGYPAIPFLLTRIKRGLISFDMSERWLKKGWMSLLSPRILKQFFYYHLQEKNAPLYKLCCSAFAKKDQYTLHTYFDKCYKWGYFTKLIECKTDTVWNVQASKKISILWCARFLKWKHPELVVKLASLLKTNDYNVKIDMYGSGKELENMKKLCQQLDVDDVVSFMGNVPNEQIHQAMQEHNIFLFTSDRNEGWGAVLNEAMSNACTVVASDEIGSVPFLVRDNYNGMIFESKNIDSLYKKVVMLIENPQLRCQLAMEGYKTIRDMWSPRIAAQNLLKLIEELRNGRETSIVEGPCSKA